MDREDIISEIKKKRSFLCVGLDTDINKIPKHLLDSEDPIFSFWLHKGTYATSFLREIMKSLDVTVY